MNEWGLGGWFGLLGLKEFYEIEKWKLVMYLGLIMNVFICKDDSDVRILKTLSF